MAYQAIGIGSSANDGTGDTLRIGADKVNDNFVEVYTKLGNGSALTSDTVTLNTATQTLTNKTLTTPVIGIINNGGNLTLPTGSVIQTVQGFSGTKTITNTSANGDAIECPASVSITPTSASIIPPLPRPPTASPVILPSPLIVTGIRLFPRQYLYDSPRTS